MPVSEQKFQKRQIAHKIRIRDILDSKYTKADGFNPNYLEINGKEISRINIVGVIIQKLDMNNYESLMVDDGTGKISTRIFENNLSLDSLDTGDVVIVIGKPREFLSEKYVLIEIVKKVDPVWAKVRKLELEEKVKDNKKFSDGNFIGESDFGDQYPKTRILKLIKSLDKGEGVSIEDIQSENIDDMDKILDLLLKEGNIFELKPGKLKVLE